MLLLMKRKNTPDWVELARC